MEIVRQADVVPHLHYKGAPSFQGPPTQSQNQPEDIALEPLYLHAQGQHGSLSASATHQAVDAERSSQMSAQGTTNAESTARLPFRAHAMYAATLTMMFLAGWNDGTTGPLLPRIQVAYNVRLW